MTEREHFENLARRAQESQAYQKLAAEEEAQKERDEARARGARMRASALRAVVALDAGKQPLTTQVEEMIRGVLAGVESLAAWATAVKQRRVLTPIEIPGVKSALAAEDLERVLHWTDRLLFAPAEDRPKLVERFRADEARRAR